MASDYERTNTPEPGTSQPAAPQPIAANPASPTGAYWAANLRIARVLLAIWFVVTFVVGFFARELSFTFFGWPFSFWVAAQGALIVYCLIIWYYAFAMNRLDRACTEPDRG